MMTIQLLVSVRNSQEAMIAADGGADIIDVKEPDSGSLGFAGAATIRDVVDAVADRVPVSAALGECLDWSTGDMAIDTLRFDGKRRSLSYVKLGLAGLLSTTAGDLWVDEWLGTRRRFDSCLFSRKVAERCMGSRSEEQLEAAAPCAVAADQPRPGWVAVAYADHEQAGSPPWCDVLQAAQSSNCEILLIDTHGKDGLTTLDWLSESELVEIQKRCHRSQLKFALAGQLNRTHLPIIKRIQPDVFAVRGAVCDGLDRCSTVSTDKVKALKTALQ
ncbi:MAG: (5-formylfuran-3-yl)methyl phosphate synthase [Fuerstiella sp.]